MPQSPCHYTRSTRSAAPRSTNGVRRVLPCLMLALATSLGAQIVFTEDEFVDQSRQHLDVAELQRSYASDLRASAGYGDFTRFLGGYAFGVYNDASHSYRLDAEGTEYEGDLYLGKGGYFVSIPGKLGGFGVRHTVMALATDMFLSVGEEDSFNIGTALLSWETDIGYASAKAGLFFDLTYQRVRGSDMDWFNRASVSDASFSVGIEKLTVDMLANFVRSSLNYLNAEYRIDAGRTALIPYLRFIESSDSFSAGMRSRNFTLFGGALSLEPEFAYDFRTYALDTAGLFAALDVSSFASRFSEKPVEHMFLSAGASYLASFGDRSDLLGFRVEFGQRAVRDEPGLADCYFGYAVNDAAILSQFSLPDTGIFYFVLRMGI